MIKKAHQANQGISLLKTPVYRNDTAEKNYFSVLDKMAARVESRGPELYAGTDVIYLGHIGDKKFKYGQSSNFSQRLLTHKKTKRLTGLCRLRFTRASTVLPPKGKCAATFGNTN